MIIDHKSSLTDQLQQYRHLHLKLINHNPKRVYYGVERHPFDKMKLKNERYIEKQLIGEQEQQDNDTHYNLWNKDNFIRAEFTNNERTHVRVYFL